MIKWTHCKTKESERNEGASENSPLLHKFSRNQETWALDKALLIGCMALLNLNLPGPGLPLPTPMKKKPFRSFETFK